MELNVKSRGAVFEISGKIRWDEIRNLYQEELEKFSKAVKIPGFRPGKASLDIVEERYGEEVKAKAIEAKVSEILNLQSKEKKYWIDILQKQEFVWSQTGDVIDFSVKFEAIPRKKLDTDLKLEKPSMNLSDKEIDEEIELLRERYAVAEDSDKTVISEDDVGIFDLLVKDIATGKVIIKEDNKLIYVKRAEDWFKNLVIGMKVGEKKEIVVSAGWKGKVRVVLKQIKNRVLPDNEDLAKALGYSSETQMIEDIKRKLLEDRRKKVLQMMYTNFIFKIMEKNKVDLPRSLVEYMFRKYAAEMKELNREQSESLAVFLASELVVLSNLKEDQNIQISDEEFIKFVKEKVLEEAHHVDGKLLDQFIADRRKRESIEEIMKIEKARRILMDKIAGQYL